MAALKTYQLGLDVTNATFINDDGKIIPGSALRLTYGDTVKFSLDCEQYDHGAGTHSTYAIPAGTTLKAVIRNQALYSQTAINLALAETWTITDGDNGLAEFELDLATNEMEAFVQGHEKRQAWLEIELTASSGEVLTTIGEAVDARWGYIGESPNNPTAQPGYYTKTESDARYINDDPTGATLGDVLVYNGTNFVRLAVGTDGEVLKANSAAAEGVEWGSGGAGSGDVSAAANLTDNAIVRGDGGAKGVQDSGVLVDDSDNLSGANNVDITGTLKASTMMPPTGEDLHIHDQFGQLVVDVSNSGVVINENSIAGMDFRVETDNNQNALLIDSSDDSIGFFGNDSGVASEVKFNGSAWVTDELRLDGDVTYNGDAATNMSMGGNKITSLDAPTVAADAATKGYVDDHEAAVTAITLTIDGGGSAIAAGALKSFPTIPYSGTIQSVELAADQTGSLVVDVWKANNAIPTNANTITAAAPPTLSAAQRSVDATLTGWTTAVTAGDVLGFEVDSAATVTHAVLTIKIKKA